jgi:hypothetical protein
MRGDAFTATVNGGQISGWSTAYVVGPSWGRHLALHVAAAMPDRLAAG